MTSTFSLVSGLVAVSVILFLLVSVRLAICSDTDENSGVFETELTALDSPSTAFKASPRSPVLISF